MSTANATLYYTAIDELLLNTSDQQQVEPTKPEEPQTDTPKRPVRIRQHNLFAKDVDEFVICRRIVPQPPAAELAMSPGSLERHKQRQAEELLRLRRERCEAEQRKPTRRLTIRI